MKLIFLGPPGAGKGTQALGVSSRLNVPHISTGNMLRAAVRNETPMGLAAKKFMDAGQLVPDEVLIEMVRERLSMVDCRTGYLLDGFPRTVAQADALAGFVQLDAVVNLEVPFDKLTARITSRRVCRACGATMSVDALPSPDAPCPKCGGEMYQRADDTVETITNRLNVYSAQTSPLVEYYTKNGLIKNVNGDQSIDDVTKDVCALLEQL